MGWGLGLNRTPKRKLKIKNKATSDLHASKPTHKTQKPQENIIAVTRDKEIVQKNKMADLNKKPKKNQEKKSRE